MGWEKPHATGYWREYERCPGTVPESAGCPACRHSRYLTAASAAEKQRNRS